MELPLASRRRFSTPRTHGRFVFIGQGIKQADSLGVGRLVNLGERIKFALRTRPKQMLRVTEVWSRYHIACHSCCHDLLIKHDSSVIHITLPPHTHTHTHIHTYAHFNPFIPLKSRGVHWFRYFFLSFILYFLLYVN